jgi:hypothetical protein
MIRRTRAGQTAGTTSGPRAVILTVSYTGDLVQNAAGGAP